MNGNKRGFSLFEMLIVVAIMGIVSVAAVPVAEITYIKNQEALLEKNMEEIKLAISLWKRDCRNVVTAAYGYDGLFDIPDSQLYPPGLHDLVKPAVAGYKIYHKDGATLAATFYPKPYLDEMPADPFVGAAKWVIHCASGTTGLYEAGITTIPVNASGVFDISCVDNTGNQRRGFVTAIDGTRYQDW